MLRNQRKKCFVDRQVQGPLVRRSVVYIFLVLILVSLLSAICFTVMEGPLIGAQLTERMWARLGPAWVASILLIPIVVIDCIRLSNRFAGPMLRLRRAMKDFASGKDVPMIRLRKGDFWHDFAEDFNQMLLERKASELACERKANPSESVASDAVLSGL